MSNNKAASFATIATGEIDERDLDHVSGGMQTSPLMIDALETPFMVGKISLKQLRS